jgi:tRNA pseudouridine38-40 synthase
MLRYFIELQYQGTNYHGWQYQPNAMSVQEVIEKDFSKMLSLEIKLVGCGRTDTGVHASQFFAHMEIEKELDLTQATYKINKILPKDIAVLNMELVDIEKHARFSARDRSYEYFLHQHKSAFHPNSWYYPFELNVDKMNLAAELIVGEKDFSCFSKSRTQTHNNICIVRSAKWIKTANGIVFQISANRFLRNMVRAIVGTLVEVGRGKVEPEQVLEIIESKSRSNAGVSVPAHGLFLSKVVY